MPLDAHRQLDERITEIHAIHDALITEIGAKLDQGPRIVEQAMYRACVTTGARIVEAVALVHEFLACVAEMTRPVEPPSQEQEQAPESPFMGTGE